MQNNSKTKGIFIIKRENKSYQELVNSLASVFSKFTAFNKEERIENKLQAKKLADMADWNFLSKYYIEAHNLAADRIE